MITFVPVAEEMMATSSIQKRPQAFVKECEKRLARFVDLRYCSSKSQGYVAQRRGCCV